MSARGRAAVDPTEFYRTPEWGVPLVFGHIGAPMRILDIGCGDGVIGKMLRERFPAASITGVELDEGRAKQARSLWPSWGDAEGLPVYREVLVGDLIESPLLPSLSPIPSHYAGRFDLVISNPPFSNAEKFLAVARRMVAYGGTIAFLLRMAWAVPTIREDVLEVDVKPDFDLIVSRRRMFPDSTEYAWHTWKPSDPLHGGRWLLK